MRPMFTVAELRQFCHHFIGRQIRDPVMKEVIGTGHCTRIDHGKLIVVVRCNPKWRHRLRSVFVEIPVLQASGE